jgi:hypothetical protein
MADARMTDPLGRSVVLHDRTWFAHIVVAHPDVAEYRDLVERTLSAPDEIRLSRAAEDCRLYFGMGPRPGVRMIVVVDITRGLVKTAHLCKKLSGGAAEWSR